MFDGEGREERQPPQLQAPKAEAVVVGGTAPDSSPSAGVTSPEKPVTASATPAEKPKASEFLTDAEKKELRKRAVLELNKLRKEADAVVTAPDYIKSAGYTPGQADIKNFDGLKNAIRQRLRYFHPDIANRKVVEILGDVARIFPELADQAQLTRLACEGATRTLNNAADFLSDEARRTDYLAKKYNIRAGAPEGEQGKADARAQQSRTTPGTEQTRQSTNPGGAEKQRQKRRPETSAPGRTPDFSQAFAPGFASETFVADDDEIFDDSWAAFAKFWQERNPQVDPTEQPVKPGQRLESVLEKVKQMHAERRFNEMVTLGLEALNEVKDMDSLKFVLELILAFYDVLKTKFSLKQNKGTMPNDTVMLALESMLNMIEKPKDANAIWAPKRVIESQLAVLKNSASIMLNYLKPKSPLGSPLGMAA